VAKQGETLTVSQTLADDDGLGTLNYQWKADGQTLAGATSSTLVLTQSHVGKAISVMASYTDGLGTEESVSSTATAAVLNVNDAPTGVLQIYGRAGAGLALSIVKQISDPDGLPEVEENYGYQWLAGSVPIPGAIQPTLKLSKFLAGSSISVKVTFTDQSGVLESLESVSSEPVMLAALKGEVRTWSGANPLEGVWISAVRSGHEFGADQERVAISDRSGDWTIDGLDFDKFALSPRKAVSRRDLDAISSSDVLAALKLSVGRNPNPDPDGPGNQSALTVPAFQFVAADCNLDGIVTVEDAKAVLIQAVITNEDFAAGWLFFSEREDYLHSSRINVPSMERIDSIADVITSVQLVSVLLGDVDGSWTP
jgi:hypothetical protein